MQETNDLTPATTPINVIMSIDPPTAAKEIAAIAKFQQLVNSQLVSGQDYGVIPGTQKPTLLKPGAEKILMLLGMKSEYRVTDKVEDFDGGFFAYTVKASLYHNGQLITQGLGAANTRESRYRQNEWTTGENGRREKSWDGSSYQDPYTLQNTVLKMAKKRAQVDATLTVGSLSNVFTQDIEDMKNFTQNEATQTMGDSDAASVVITFGKHKGQTIGEVMKTNPSYVRWMAENTQNAAMKQAAEMVYRSAGHSGKLAATNNKVPSRPAPARQAPQTPADDSDLNSLDEQMPPQPDDDDGLY